MAVAIEQNAQTHPNIDKTGLNLLPVIGDWADWCVCVCVCVCDTTQHFKKTRID